MATVHLDVLGPPDLRVGGTSVDVETRKAIAVLAYVVLEGPQRRDTLDVLLWPESDATRARATLRRTLSALRKVVPDGLLAGGDDVALAGEVTTDLDEVERLVGHDGRGTRDPEQLAAADALHRGDFLAGLHFRDSDPFEHWRRDTAERVKRRHTAILERWCRVLIDAGDHAGAIDVAERRLAMDPLHEPSHQQLMLLYAWQDDRGAAARQYAECVRILDEELGVAPLPRTTALDRAVRAGRIEPPPVRGEGAREPTGQSPSNPAAPASALPLPFVGRDTEIEQVLMAHQRCGPDGALVVVRGEAGIGKTRLARELTAGVAGRTIHVAVQTGEAALAYAPVTAALRLLRDDLAEVDDDVRRELARLAPDVAGLRPPADALSSPGARTRLVEACVRALSAALADADDPGVLVIDDLDRADPETRELVVYLCHRLADRPMLVVATCRDDRVLGLPASALHIDLTRLGTEEVRLLAAAQDAEDVAPRLHAESEGVPYLVVSYLAALRSGAGWDLPRDGRDLVRSRLDQLGEVARQVLAAASVLGGAQAPDVLVRVSGRAEDEVVDAIEQLTAAGLLAAEDDEDGRYGFTHDKVRAVVLDDTSHVRRRLLHRRAADALAVAVPPVPAATLARHLEAAGQEDEAAEAHVAAGRRAARLYANAEAVDHLEAALALGHPHTGALLVEVGALLVRLGGYAEAAQRYTRAAAHGADAVLVEHRLGALALREGRDEAADGHLRHALEAATEDDPRRAAVLADLARALLRRGQLDAAAEHAAAAVQAADQVVAADGGAGAGAALARAHNVAGLVARRRGELDAADSHLRASLAQAQDAEQRAAALNNLALVRGEAGALDEALVIARDALDAGRAVADRHREAALLNNLADLLHAAGRTDEALQLQGEAAERFAGVGDAPMTTPEIWQLVDW